MAGDETKELVKAIKEIPSHVKKPIHERKVGHWLQGVDAVIQLLPSDANIQDADKKNAQTILANIMLGLIEEPGGEPRAQGVGSGERRGGEYKEVRLSP